MAGSAAGPPGRVDKSAVEAALTVARGIKWWVTSVMGDNAYARYTDHLARNHPDDPVPTEREYWRQRYADQEARPGARCC